MSTRRHLLVLYWYPPWLTLRSAVAQHLRALDYGVDRIVYHNAFVSAPPWVRRLDVDAIFLHTTFLCARWHEHFETYRRSFAWVAERDCPKVALPQDEYDHSAVLDEWLAELGVTAVFTNFGPDTRSVLYPTMSLGARFDDALTGYIDEAAAERIVPSLRPSALRPVDIVYRATQLPYWFGSHGQLKHQIADVVERAAERAGLTTDISTLQKDTILGPGWLKFLASGRVVIGCESGSSVLDPRGEIQARIRSLLAHDEEVTFGEVDRMMPDGWDDWQFFAISPRHLEAVVTKTCQVLVEGTYSGVLQPDRHFVPLRRDFSNLDEVLERVKDDDLLEEMTERAYEEIYLSGRFTTLAFGHNLVAGLPAPRPRSRSARVQSMAQMAAAQVVDRGLALASRVPRPLAVRLARLRSLETRVRRRPRPRSSRLLRRAGALKAAFGTRNSRRLIAAYVRAAPARRLVSLRPVLADAARLGVLDGNVRSGSHSPVATLSLQGDGRLVLRSGGAPEDASTVSHRQIADALRAGEVTSVVWDFSTVGSIGSVAPSATLPGALDGRYEFSALGALLRENPESATAILLSVLEGLAGRASNGAER